MVPRLQHWFSGSAFFGVALIAYNVLVGIISIAPITESSLKWGLFIVGCVLTIGTWYFLARTNADSERRERDAARDRNELPGRIATELTGLKNLKGEFDEALERVRRAEGRVEEEVRARQHITELFDTVVESLERTVKNDVVGISAIGTIKGTLSDSSQSPEERVAEASRQATAYYGKRASGRIVFPGDAEALRAQLAQNSDKPPAR
jgi:hypothetical protein